MSNVIETLDYTGYRVMTPDWFIEKLKARVNDRDLKSIFGVNSEGVPRIAAINVEGDHPFVLMLGAILPTGNVEQTAGILPMIGVTEQDLPDEEKQLGHSFRGESYIDQAYINAAFKAYTQQQREEFGLIGDEQIQRLEGWMQTDNLAALRVEQHEHQFLEMLMISVWCNTRDEIRLLTPIVYSCLNMMRRYDLTAAQLPNNSLSATRGLRNSNFGRIIFGVEFTLKFYQSHFDYRVYRQKPLDMNARIDIQGTYVPRGNPTDKFVRFTDEEIASQDTPTP